MKDVLLVVARRYNGHELWTALGVLQEAGKTFEVVSTDYQIEDEVTGRPNVLDRTLDDLELQAMTQEFHSLMIVSGNMKDTEAYWTDERVQYLVRLFDQAERPLAAICCSVPTLAPAVEGVKVSFFPLIRSRQRLSEHGAILQTTTVTVDGRVATAENQMGTQMWAASFVKVLNGEDGDPKLHDSGFVPKGRERKPIPELEAIKKARGQ
ncbi:MAG: DJ-1/PfpI family protein [bacterium]